MKQIEFKYTQLIGKALVFNVLADSRTKDHKEKETIDVNFENSGMKGYKKIGSKKLYGFTLIVNQLMNY